MAIPNGERALIVEAAWWAFLFFYHHDESAAKIHCAPVKFSPITFRLAESLALYASDLKNEPEIIQVLAHVGKYEDDRGRP
jgi:hypothetical protein